MSKHDDYKKAGKMTAKEMADAAGRGRKWENSGQFWDDFKGRFKDNLWVVQYGWIVIVVILAIVIISSENSSQRGVCHHNIETRNYIMRQYGPNFVLEDFCTLCQKDFVVYAESSTFVEYKQPTCEDMGANVYKVVFKIKNSKREVMYHSYSGSMLGHLKPEVLIEDYVPATCLNDGHHETYDCLRCNKRINGSIIEKLPHTTVEDLVQIEPTCLSEGRTPGVYCSVCNSILSGYDTIPIVPCSYDSVVTEPTYTTMGYTTHTCKWCNDVYVDDYKKALVYNYVNLTTIEGRESEGLYINSIAEGCTAESIIIPEEVDGVKIVGVNEYAFKNIKTLKSITLPSTIKVILNNAFEDCENLTTINLDENITSIGNAAFKDCISLTSVTLNSKIENLNNETFAGCENLKSITLNSSIKNIKEKVFYNCKQLSQIVLPETLLSVDSTAFKECIRLVEVYDLKNSFSASYPESVLSVKTSLEQQSGIEVYGDFECVRANDNKLYMFRFTPSNQEKFVMPKTFNDEDYTLLPYSLTEIKSFTDITISNIAQTSFKQLISDESYYNNAKMQVTNLCLDIESEIPSSYFVDCFYGIKKVVIKNLITEGAVEADEVVEIEMPVLFKEFRKVFAGLSVPYYISKITFTSGESIPQDYCKGIKSLTDLVLPDSLITIGSAAFRDCENLTNVTFGSGLERVGASAFYACYNIKELNLPISLKHIEAYAFMYCNSIERVVIPQNVKSIDYDAFNICVNIKEVYNLSSLNIVARTSTYGSVAENVYYVYTSLDEENKIFFEGDYVFVLQKDNHYHLVAYNGESESLTLPESFNGEDYILDARVFKDCYTIKNLVIGDNITQIPDEAFSGLSSLQSVVIGSGVTSIGDNAFNGCTNLSSVTFASSVKQIGENAFYECGFNVSGEKIVKYDGTPLTWLEIEFANEKATPMSFANKILMNVDGEYESVTSIMLPSTVTEIRAYQFYGFNEVKTLVVPSSVKKIGTKAFYNATAIESAEIPAINGVFPSLIKVVTINTNIPQNFFTGWNNLTTVTVAEGVTSISDKAFENCAALVSVSFPASLVNVGSRVFDGCSALSSLNVNSQNENYTSLAQGFGLVEKSTKTLLLGNETSVIEEGIEIIAPYAFYNNRKVTTMVIPNSVKQIGDYAFYNCYALNDFVLSNNVVSVGAYAFYNCFNISSADYSTSTKLTSIGDYAFYNCDLIDVISLPKSLVSLGKNAFDSDCNSLTSVTMPALSATFANMFGGAAYLPKNLKSVTIISGDIPTQYFSGCAGLTDITILGATSIGEKAFYYCGALVNLSLCNTITSIENYAFSNCTALESLTLPSDLESLGAGAFEKCKKLKNILLPKNVTKLNVYTFSGCSALESITYESGSQINEIDKCVIDGCTALTSFVVPSSVTKLWSSALYGNIALQSLSIPKLEFIDTYRTDTKLYALFGGGVPSSLKSVTILSATSIPAEAFYGCSYIENITFPDSVISIGKNAFYNCTSLTYKIENGLKYLSTSTNDYFCLMGMVDSSLTTVQVNSNCKIIYSDVFKSKTSLQQVSLPEGLISIGEGAFSGCTSLTEIALPSSLKEIGASAFVSTSLMAIAFPQSLLVVGDYAFSGLTSLQTISFASGCLITSIGKEAFKNCTSLTSVDFTNATRLKTIGESCFIGCVNIESVVFSNSIEEINKNAFSSLTKITSLSLPSSLKVIGDYAFYKINVSVLNIPNSVQSIGSYSFYHCSNLTTLTFANNSLLTNIGDYAFSECNMLASIDFGENNSLSQIGNSSFSLCQALTSITLPNKLKVIGESAFAYCNKLTSVLFESGSVLEELKDLSFEGCTKLNEIHLAKSVKKIGLAFCWAKSDFTLYYGGSVSDWNRITISKGQNAAYQIAWLTNATIVYNS